MEIGAGIGAKLASTSIYCGGILTYNESYYSSDKCFKYTKGGWQNFATLFAIPIPVDLPFHEFAIPCVPLILFSHEGLLGVVVLEELDRVELELNLFMMSAVDGTLAEGIYF